MKKILISILIVLLLILCYFAIDKGINLGVFKIYGFDDIKTSSLNLDQSTTKAKELAEQTYPSEISNLDKAIEDLKTSMKSYENKKKYSSDDVNIGAIEVKTYKIHYLWTVLGDYKINKNLETLNLDLKTTKSADVYDLNFNLVGSYDSVIDFIEEIENDDNLNFQIENFVMEQYQTETTITITSSNKNTSKTINPFNKIIKVITRDLVPSQGNNETSVDENNNNESNNKTTNNTTTTYDPKWVEVSFTAKNIGITLD